MNYEVDQYVEAGRKLPSREMVLQTQDAEFYLFKADILSGMVTYSSDRRLAANLTTITAERAMAIIAMNKEGEKPASLQAEGVVQESGVVDLATQDDMNRFDKKKKKKNIYPPIIPPRGTMTTMTSCSLPCRTTPCMTVRRSAASLQTPQPLTA